MNLKPKRLVSGTTLGTTAAALYTAPANTKAIVKKASFTNSGGAAALLTVYLVPSGGTAGADNIICNEQSLAAKETFALSAAQEQVVEAGGSLQALSDTAASINAVVSGFEVV